MYEIDNLVEFSLSSLDGQTLDKVNLRQILDTCLAKGYSFRVKKQLGQICQYKLFVYSRDNTEIVTFSIKQLKAHKKNFLYWTGSKTLAVVGPDGSGKTTLLDAIKADSIGKKLRFKRFKRYFRRVSFYIFRNESRNDRDEKMLWLILPLSWCTFTFARFLTIFSKPTLLDRYFYDYLVRNVRETDKPFSKVRLYDWWVSVLPKPTKLIIAICPPEEIHNRKQEMSVPAIHDLYDIYIDQLIYAGLPDVLFCNTSLKPEISCQQAVEFISDLK